MLFTLKICAVEVRTKSPINMCYSVLLWLWLSSAYLNVSDGFQWSTSDMLQVTGCAGDNVTLPWNYVMQSSESADVIDWSYGTQQTVIATFKNGQFSPEGVIKDRLQWSSASSTALTITNVRLSDTGLYRVTLTARTQPDGGAAAKIVYTASVLLTVVEPPRLSSGALTAAEVTSEDRCAHGQRTLACGHFLSLGLPPLDIVWTDPAGQLLSSSRSQDGRFYLDLPLRPLAGNYSCRPARHPTTPHCLPPDSPLLGNRAVPVHLSREGACTPPTEDLEERPLVDAKDLPRAVAQLEKKVAELTHAATVRNGDEQGVMRHLRLLLQAHYSEHLQQVQTRWSRQLRNARAVLESRQREALTELEANYTRQLRSAHSSAELAMRQLLTVQQECQEQAQAMKGLAEELRAELHQAAPLGGHLEQTEGIDQLVNGAHTTPAVLQSQKGSSVSQGQTNRARAYSYGKSADGRTEELADDDGETAKRKGSFWRLEETVEAIEAQVADLAKRATEETQARLMADQLLLDFARELQTNLTEALAVVTSLTFRVNLTEDLCQEKTAVNGDGNSSFVNQTTPDDKESEHGSWLNIPEPNRDQSGSESEGSAQNVTDARLARLEERVNDLALEVVSGLMALSNETGWALRTLQDNLTLVHSAVTGVSRQLELLDRGLKLVWPSDCEEAQQRNVSIRGGAQLTYAAGNIFYVVCNLSSDGTMWTVFQNRYDGSVHFHRNWTAYEEGFGDLNGEFWLGLRFLHLLTTSRDYVLRIELEDQDGIAGYAEYSQFLVEGPQEQYRLNVGGYSGTIGDSLTDASRSWRYHDGQRFTTSDRDHDQRLKGNCGADWGGGWWFNACAGANLNGNYSLEPGPDRLKAVNWYAWHRDWRTYRATRMKFRRQV